MKKDIFEMEDGYYYRTEDDDMEGPFPNLEIAQTAFNAYIKWLNHDHMDKLRKMRDYYD